MQSGARRQRRGGDNPCYAAYNPASPSCTFSSGGRTASYNQNGGKRVQAILAMDAIFHF
jgi:hypothetical protein